MDTKSEITDADIRDADAHIVSSACVRLGVCVYEIKNVFHFISSAT